jgi:hypothetical protein
LTKKQEEIESKFQQIFKDRYQKAKLVYAYR